MSAVNPHSNPRQLCSIDSGGFRISLSRFTKRGRLLSCQMTVILKPPKPRTRKGLLPKCCACLSSVSADPSLSLCLQHTPVREFGLGKGTASSLVCI